jgi:hypothetical protein
MGWRGLDTALTKRSKVKETLRIFMVSWIGRLAFIPFSPAAAKLANAGESTQTLGNILTNKPKSTPNSPPSFVAISFNRRGLCIFFIC